ncbi:hypothetical protein CBR_g677 [Chara braunii]|uniref:CCHC-type domain-containing protein n=1 Tax=Chara braunii TaxID=69332 RepID=A0A388KC17_CHABU|nr:hypothetical protein CBR_g677 [Chara braunii]|eukprot:GBG67546.1 hypothetical protein CBR_g677 [Chara braunii]
MVRTDFVRGLSNSHLRKKIRKKCNPIEHTLTEFIQYAIKYGKENYDVGLDSESDEDDPSGVRRHSYSATARMFEDRFGLGPTKKGSDRKASSSASTSCRSNQAQGGRDEEKVSMKEVGAQLVTVVAPLTKFVQGLQRQRIAAAQRQQAAMAAGAPMMRPTVVGAVPPLRCYNCNQPGHLAKDCPKPRPAAGPSQIPLAAPAAAGQGRVATVMDTGTTEMVAPAAAEIGPDEYMAAAMFEPETIGVIRHVQRITEESDLGPWRPGFEDLTAPGPEYKDGHINVLDALKALDLRIPVPIPYLLTISEAANEKLIERCLKNRRRFEENRKSKKPAIQDLPTTEEAQPSTSRVHEANRVGMIQTVDPAPEKPEYHVEHIEWVLHALKDAGFKVALEKSEFFLSEISFLGYIVTVEGLKPDPMKVAAVREAPVPVTLTQVRAFLGMASYYRRFIQGCACLAKPLTNLLKKEEQLIWTPECEAAFQALKEALTSAPVLARPDPTRPFALHTNWQPQAISAVLTQHGVDGREHVIEYASKMLSQTQSNYEACKGECLAVVWGIQHFRSYLYGQKFVLITDQQPPLSLRNNTDYTGKLGRWAVRLQDYDIDIRHRATRQHGNADGLTRLLPPNKCPANERLIPWRPEATPTEPRYGELHTSIADCLLWHQFNEERQFRYDIQQVNVAAPRIADLATYSLLCERLTYAGVYVDVTQLPRREMTRVFIEFHALQVAPNFVHSTATFIGDLTILAQEHQDPVRNFVRDYAVQVARSVARVQGRGGHQFTAHDTLLRRAEDGSIALEYLVELTDVEPLPFADEDAWELHRALYQSVVLGMFRFSLEHDEHNIGEHFVVYYIITRPKPAQKEGTVALYPFGKFQTKDLGLLELIHLELLSIAQVIASEEEDIKPRLRTPSAPRRTFNAVMVPDYIAQYEEKVVDFRDEKPLRPPSSYPRPAPPKAPRRTPKRKRRHPSPGAQDRRVGGGEEVVQPVHARSPDPVPASAATLVEEPVMPSPPIPRLPDLNLDGARPSAAAAGRSRVGLPYPASRLPVLAGPFRFRQPPRGAPVTLAVPPSRTVHPTELGFRVEPTTIRLEAIAGVPRPDPAWEPYFTPPFHACIEARMIGTLIYETGQRPNAMYHFLIFAAQKRERQPYTKTHLVKTGPEPRSVRKRVVRAVADLASYLMCRGPSSIRRSSSTTSMKWMRQ